MGIGAALVVLKPFPLGASDLSLNATLVEVIEDRGQIGSKINFMKRVLSVGGKVADGGI